MDENQDLTVGSDGTMKEGTGKTNAGTTAGPVVNKLAPPPESTPAPIASAPVEQPPESVIPVKQAPIDDESALDGEQPVISEAPKDLSGGTSALKEQPNEDKVGVETTTLAEAVTRDAQPKSKKPKKTGENRNNKKLAAVVTILVALGLAGGAVYVYLSTQNNAEKSASTTNSENTTQDQSAANEEIRQAKQQVDEAIKAAEEEAGIDGESSTEESLAP